MSAITLYLTSGPARSFFLRMGLVMFFIVISSIISNAATETWVPINGGAWNIPANWSGNAVPTTNDDVIIPVSQSLPITAVQTTILHSLTINGNCTFQSPGNVTLTLGGNAGTDFTVSGGFTLTLGGTVNITLAANATAQIDGTLTIGAAETFNTDGNTVMTTVSTTGSILNSGTCNLQYG